MSVHEAQEGGRRERPPFARPTRSEIPNQDGVYADKGHMNPRQGNALLRRLAIFAISIAVFGGTGSVAQADESAVPTTQAVAYNAEWVPYLDPPAKPAAVCLVDSGVNVTPDTPADSPDGPILKRLSLDGGPGTAANNTWEGLHGTRMAFVGSAPINGWGAVGFWPGARIVSIRAMPPGETTFQFDSYSRAVDLCNKEAHNVLVVNLSLACDCEPTAEEHQRLENQIARAHNNGQSIVAAAGNANGSIRGPAAEPGVLAVAAGDKAGRLCDFSNRGSGVDVLAPGCDTDLADPQTGTPWTGYASGTSGAAMTTSITLALLRSYSPGLDRLTAEEILLKATRQTDDGSARLDVEEVFRAAGLSRLVDAAKGHVAPSALDSQERDPSLPPPGTDLAPPADALRALAQLAPARRRLTSPKLRPIRIRRRRLTVAVRDRPKNARLRVSVEAPRREFAFSVVARAKGFRSCIVLRLPADWTGGRVVASYDAPTSTTEPSRPIYRRVPA
jgi:Subtilase family